MKINLGQKVRQIRELKGYSQEYIASKMGVSQRAYSKMENNETRLDWNKISKIAEIFEIELSELVDLSEKGTVTINFSNQENRKSPKSKICISLPNTELEKSQLIIELKDKELALQQREIAYLKELLEIHKREKP